MLPFAFVPSLFSRLHSPAEELRWNVTMRLFPHARPRLEPLSLAERLEPLLVGLTLLYFAARLVFFAVEIDPSVPPDEMTHLGRSLAFGEHVWIPPESEETHEFGLMHHRPVLFYLIMGKVLWLGFLPVSDLVLLRLVNVLMGLGVAVYGYLWLRLWVPVVSGRVLALVMMTNVLMFTGVSASLSYDNLTNLLGAAALFHLFAYFRDGRPLHLAAFQLAVFAGCLTKTAFLPLAFILEVVLLVRSWRDLPGTLRELGGCFRLRQWRVMVVASLAVVMLLSTAYLYGGNVLRFGRLVPKENQVLALEQAMRYRIFARNYVVSEFRKGNLSYEEAVAMAEEIQNPGNRRRALNLLYRAKDPEALLASVLEPAQYAPAWVKLMLADGLGYHGHRVIRKLPRDVFYMEVMLLVAGLIAWRKWRPGEAEGVPLWAGVITFFYAMVLMWLVNYRHYFRAGMLDFALQGRYIFPVLVPLCGLVAYYLTAHLPARSRWLVAAAVAVLFLMGDLPWFLDHVNRCWFMGASEIPRCAL